MSVTKKDPTEAEKRHNISFSRKENGLKKKFISQTKICGHTVAESGRARRYKDFRILPGKRSHKRKIKQLGEK